MFRLGLIGFTAPALVLGFMVLAGWIDVVPALAVTSVLGAIFASILWLVLHDLEALTATVRGMISDTSALVPSETGRPVFLDGLHRELRRLARSVHERTVVVEQQRRADTRILERLPDPVIVLASDRSVRRVNNAGRVAFGGDLQAVLRHPGLVAAIDAAIRHAAIHTADLDLPVPIPREVRATVVPMEPPLADGGEAVVVLSDRTRERVSDRMRADFVANVSHELRTPLASVMGFIETLQGPAADDPPAQKRFLDIMAEQAARMNRLIDDLLNLSRIELNEHQPPEGRLDLRVLVPKIVEGLEPRFAQGQSRLRVDVPADLPLVNADSDQFAQVLQNILDNALKYGSERSIVELRLRCVSGGADWPTRPGVVTSVTDQGPGISREHLPRLTERFYRVDKGRSRTVGGTGLGLAIVKHIVNRHRGQLLIESEENVGTTVTVWLPLAEQGLAGPVGG